MNRRDFDLSAYLVIGPENTLGRPVEDIIEQAIRAGMSFIQIRSKEASARQLIEWTGRASSVIAKTRPAKVALVVNDRLDVVLAARDQGIKVDGIHVGQSDIPVDVCRKYLGEDAIIGLSARTDQLIEYVQSVDPSDIDYFGAGPLHETATKPDCGLSPTGQVITRSLDELSIARKVRVIFPQTLSNTIPGNYQHTCLKKKSSCRIDFFCYPEIQFFEQDDSNYDSKQSNRASISNVALPSGFVLEAR